MFGMHNDNIPSDHPDLRLKTQNSQSWGHGFDPHVGRQLFSRWWWFDVDFQYSMSLIFDFFTTIYFS